MYGTYQRVLKIFIISVFSILLLFTGGYAQPQVRLETDTDTREIQIPTSKQIRMEAQTQTNKEHFKFQWKIDPPSPSGGKFRGDDTTSQIVYYIPPDTADGVPPAHAAIAVSVTDSDNRTDTDTVTFTFTQTPKTGSIRVIVDVQDAEVYVNNEYKGIANRSQPLLCEDIPVGEADVSAGADGHIQSQFIQVHSTQLSEVTFELEKKSETETLIEKAIEALEGKKYDDAVSHALTILHTDPENQSARQILKDTVFLYADLANKALSEASPEQATNYQKKAQEAAKHLESEADADAALDRLEQLIIGALIEKAKTSVKQKKYDEARVYAEAVIEKYPGSEDAQQVLTHIGAKEFGPSEIIPLLEIAQKYIDENYLTKPPGKNAFEIYRKVLRSDPDNQTAKHGIRDIADRYLFFAKQAMDDDKIREAEILLKRGLKVFPRHMALLRFKRKLERIPPPLNEKYDKPFSPLMVNLGKFWISKYEITFGAYDDFCERQSRKKWSQILLERIAELPIDEKWLGRNMPVIYVSWHDAWNYVKWLSRETGRRYRLPTTREWEYAALGGRRTLYYWGDNPDNACQYANVADETALKADAVALKISCNDHYVRTAPVGNFKPNNFKLYDMLGNVWEWVKDPDQGSVLKGGAWNTGARSILIIQEREQVKKLRLLYPPETKERFIGFRVVRDLD
ncbi:SUMF1/EgtB/PvdO family nonheme iron enzyme [Desulfonema magnum]|uniref:Sulfatase-modifying factor enzyme domain-containing protein n=1 Tax=Desulfonema magnum TaxID=45655 RepID=A0A975GMU1_9BACT|nr:SUMF1/EgtB/PvdO family nonheme iron enzyme [Desulfonema magnum]QTA87074.1 Sulfatase-modifying factor enzyme domain-containing protein [Desulfonema magnum]